MALWVRWSLPVPEPAAPSTVRAAATPTRVLRTGERAWPAGDVVNPGGPVAASSDNLPESGRDDPDYLQQYLRRTAVFLEDGMLRGMRVFPGSNEQAFLEAGLQDGDLVVAVDGEPLNDAARASEIMDRVGSIAGASLTVERDGIRSEHVLAHDGGDWSDQNAATGRGLVTASGESR
jgi:membrane-associated protease RseP (regulator of RpoE activity)